MTGSEALPTSCTQKRKKRTKKDAPPPPSPLIMAGKKASPPNYAHKNKKVKKGESNMGSEETQRFLHPKVYAASARALSKEEEGQHRLHACI
jgi:hypothetical protein